MSDQKPGFFERVKAAIASRWRDAPRVVQNAVLSAVVFSLLFTLVKLTSWIF